MSSALIPGLAVAVTLILATGVFAYMVRQDKDTQTVFDAFWQRFWADYSPIWVTLLGSPGQQVVLGMIVTSPESDPGGESPGDQLELMSTGFRLRTDDGRVVSVPKGEKVTLFARGADLEDGVVSLPTICRLMARLEQTHADEGGPFREGDSALRIPADIGLLIADSGFERTPFKGMMRTPRWGRLVALWIVGAVLVAAAYIAPRFLGFLLMFVVGLFGCTVLMGGAILWFALTASSDIPTTHER